MKYNIDVRDLKSRKAHLAVEFSRPLMGLAQTIHA